MVEEAWCPYCKDDYNALTATEIKCMNCYRTYPIENWRIECDKARERKMTETYTCSIFMKWKNRVWVIQTPDNVNPWEYGRKKLGVKDDEITPWGEFRLSNGVACFNYELGYSEAYVWKDEVEELNRKAKCAKLAERINLHQTVLNFAETLVRQGDIKTYKDIFGEDDITGRSNEELQAIIDKHILPK